MWLTSLFYPSMAVDALYEYGIAVSADTSFNLCGELGACPLRYSLEETRIASTELRILVIDVFSLLVKYANTLLGDVFVVATAHFRGCLVPHRVYKPIACLIGRSGVGQPG